MDKTPPSQKSPGQKPPGQQKVWYLCLKCGFPLHDVPNAAYLPPKEYQCPECGRPYKPGRANTYHNLRDGSWPGPPVDDWKVLLISAIVLVVLFLGLWIFFDPRFGWF